MVGVSVACLWLGPGALAQTADPSAAPPSTPTAAPAARAGSYSAAQGEIFAAPGLRVPNGNLPWALDSVDGKPALVPVHHSSITEPVNVEADGPGAPQTHTLRGPHARTVLHSTQPIFYVNAGDRTENTGDAGRGNPTGWALVPAVVDANGRTMPHVRFAQISKGAACEAPVLCLQAESLPGGWNRLSSAAPLPPGEYALVPVPRQARPGVVIVYDFDLDPAAPAPRDAVVAGDANSLSTGKKKRR